MKATEIDGLKYVLYSDHTAMITNDNQWEGELDIPEQVTYKGEVYTVNSLEWMAFMSCKTLTKVRLPKTISSIKHYAGWDACKNPFVQCTALESIEVDEENPWMCSVDGVLFNKEKTWLYSYPAGAKREAYDIPEGVERIGMDAFAYNPYLTSVYMPNSVTSTDGGTFANCKNISSIRLSENLKYFTAYTFDHCESLHFLDIPASVGRFSESEFRRSPIKTLVIRGSFNELRTDTFYSMDEEVVIYVQKSEMEKFQKVFSGTIRPLEEYQEIQEPEYRPFIEEGKEWNVGYVKSGNKCYGMSRYYFDGDTIVGGKAGKRMMCQTKVNEKMGDDLPITNATEYMGTIREEGRRVYIALPNDEEFVLLYDFESEPVALIETYAELLPKGVKTISTGICFRKHGALKNDDGSTAFKGNYAELYTNPYKMVTCNSAPTTWMEGVGTNAGPLFGLYIPDLGNYPHSYPKKLLSCTVGDEVLYRNSSYVWEEELDPESSCTKRRVDFTHVVKKKPKAPQRRIQENEDVAVSGEYTQRALTIDLATLQDTYVVTITDPSGQSVYAKDVKTNRVLALDIDISAYNTEEAYTITLENEDEIFEGNFRLSDLTSIHEVTTPRTPSDVYHDLMGRRVTTPSKGIYIHNGKKVLVK